MSKRLPVLNNINAAPADDSANPVGSEPFDPSFELPDLHQTQLDWNALDCVLADLDDFASIVEIQGRDAADEAVAVDDIVEAREQFVAGALTALQIVYRFADQVWCDTLMRERTGARLLRMLDPARANEP